MLTVSALNVKALRQLRVGDEVFWNDPDEGSCSDYATIVEILSEDGTITDDDTVILLRSRRGSEIECYPVELS